MPLSLPPFPAPSFLPPVQAPPPPLLLLPYVILSLAHLHPPPPIVVVWLRKVAQWILVALSSLHVILEPRADLWQGEFDGGTIDGCRCGRHEQRDRWIGAWLFSNILFDFERWFSIQHLWKSSSPPTSTITDQTGDDKGWILWWWIYCSSDWLNTFWKSNLLQVKIS